MKRRCGIGVLGSRRGTPRWEDDPVWRHDGRGWFTGQETDSPLEGILMTGGADRGDGNNILVTISDRS